ncbi:MAG: carbohydrate kinase family protein [Nanobdellota archaeon]
MALDVLTLSEAMIDIYHEQIPEVTLREIGLTPGSWNLYIPGDPECERILEHVNNLPITTEVPGSSPGNLAFTMASMGHAIGMITALGDDEKGDLYHRQIRAYGIADHTQHVPGGTNPFLHALFTDGERTFLAYTGCTPQVDLTRTFPPATYLYFSGYEAAKIGYSVMGLAENPQYTFAFDPASPDVVRKEPHLFSELMKHTRILFVSHEEYEALFDRPFNQDDPLKGHDNLEILILKEGSKGSRVITADTDTYVPACQADHHAFCNTNGAGDAYAAGFLSALLKGKKPDEAGHEGSRVSAQIVCRDEPHLPYPY